MVSYIPNFSNGKFSEGWATFIFLLGILPGVLSYIYKEKMLGDTIKNKKLKWKHYLVLKIVKS